jgi:hypothetical protein
MLVVANAYLNECTRPLVPEERFLHHLTRTIQLLYLLSPLSPAFRINSKVLRIAQNKVVQRYHELHPTTTPGTPQYYEAPATEPNDLDCNFPDHEVTIF